MGNCWSRFKSPESTNPPHHVCTPSSPPPMEPSVSTSADAVRPSPSTDPSMPTSGDSVSPPINPTTPTLGDPVSPPHIGCIESIEEMCKKNNLEVIDQLISFIETRLPNINTESSSPEGLGIVGDVTKLAAKTVDIISEEAEKLSKLGVVKAMGNQAVKVMKGVGQLHWVFIGLSLAAYAVDSYLNVGRATNECNEILLKTLELAKDLKHFSEEMPEEKEIKEKVCKVVSIIVQGAVICCNYVETGKLFRFFLSPQAAAQLKEMNEQLRDARASLDFCMNLQILKRLPKSPKLSPCHLLEFDPVGIEERVEKVKALLDMEDPQSVLAVIVCGFGGIGKSTLAAAVVQSLDLPSKEFKFSKVAIDETTSEITSHVLKLQKDIINDLGGGKLDLRDPQQGRDEVRKAIQNKSSLLFIDNVVDKKYIQLLLPKDFSSSGQKTKLKDSSSSGQKTKLKDSSSSGQKTKRKDSSSSGQKTKLKDSSSSGQKTKLRILITSRDKNVKAELNISYKVHEVAILSEQASLDILLKTIVPNEVVEDKDFDEVRMISVVAKACRGVPLLLSVFGKHLKDERNMDSYEEALDVLRKGNLDGYRDEVLGKTLMFVYDKIGEEEVKEAFLDICTYFHGWEWNVVADIVDSPKLEDLHRRILVSNSSGKVIVHDILRLMGMEKARQTRFSNLDNLDGFENTKDVKGISLVKDNSLITIESTQLEAMCETLRVLILGDWVTLKGPACEKAFSNLRYLSVGDISVFPFKDTSKMNRLRVFLNRSKAGMNLSHLPSSLKRICHEVPQVECDKIVKLPFQDLRDLKSFVVKAQELVELPEELHLPSSLVDLNINRCKNFPKDISHLTVLESLILDGSDLECLPGGLGQIKKLKHLSMNYCTKLACLPKGFGQLQKLKHLSMDYCSKLASLSEELGMLTSLEALSMKGCGNLKALPKSLGRLVSLQMLELSECVSLQVLQESIGELHVQSLNLDSLFNINELPDSFGKMCLLKDLSLISCLSLQSLPNSFVEMKMLETLQIIKCKKLVVLPEDFGRLRCLKKMIVENCDLLKELPHGFGALPALKIFELRSCNSFVNLSKEFTELTNLVHLTLVRLPLMSRIPDGFGKLKKLRIFWVNACRQLKSLSNDLENMATLELVVINGCPELDGTTMEKILKLQNCYQAFILGSSKLSEKWKHMQGESEHPIVVYSDDVSDKGRAIRVALLNGKCMEVNKAATDKLEERSSLLEEGTSATVALIMLPTQFHMQSHRQETVERFLDTARERAATNGSAKLQIVCARKVDLSGKRRTPTEEEERAEEEGIRQILHKLPEGSCAIPSSEAKRVNILTLCCSEYGYLDKPSFFMANVGIDIEGRKIFEDLKFISEQKLSGNVEIEPYASQMREVDNKDYNSIRNFIKSICQSQCVRAESKTREFIEALKGDAIHYLLAENNTSKLKVDDLHGKTIGFMICQYGSFEFLKLQEIYRDIQQKDSSFIAIWIPTALPYFGGHGSHTRLIQCIPWTTFPLPQLIDYKSIDLLEDTEAYFVLLDKDGQIAECNALPLLMGWGVKSYPFTRHTILEGFSSVESQSCLEFLLDGMNIVGRKPPTKRKMTFLYTSHPREWYEMRSKLEELTQIEGNFEVLYIGKLDKWHTKYTKQEYEYATASMFWPSVSFSDMQMFWYRCQYLAGVECMESNIMMNTLHELARKLWRRSPSLVLVDNVDGAVTCNAYDMVQMIFESSGMGMVKDELMKSLRRGECTTLLKTFLPDQIRHLPQHPHHVILALAHSESIFDSYNCGVCCRERSVSMEDGTYMCWRCSWYMCGSCWMAYAEKHVQQAVIQNHPRHPHHRFSLVSALENRVCDVCKYSIDKYGAVYSCDECDWDICGSCWMAYANQQVEQVMPAKDD